MKVALIVGHDSYAQGASNKMGRTEYQFNSELAPRIEQYLYKEGFTVEIVLRDGTSYSRLPRKVNKTHANLAISLHCNAFNTQASGTEVLHYYRSNKSKFLAECLQQQIVATLGLHDRGLKPVNVAYKGKAGDRGGHLCKHTNMPCVIIEPFFIDNDTDLALAESKVEVLAKAIAQGTSLYGQK
jgi:N-acetylmuramoyl-L-alanine amidase